VEFASFGPVMVLPFGVAAGHPVKRGEPEFIAGE